MRNNIYKMETYAELLISFGSREDEACEIKAIVEYEHEPGQKGIMFPNERAQPEIPDALNVINIHFPDIADQSLKDNLESALKKNDLLEDEMWEHFDSIHPDPMEYDLEEDLERRKWQRIDSPV